MVLQKVINEEKVEGFVKARMRWTKGVNKLNIRCFYEKTWLKRLLRKSTDLIKKVIRIKRWLTSEIWVGRVKGLAWWQTKTLHRNWQCSFNRRNSTKEMIKISDNY